MCNTRWCGIIHVFKSRKLPERTCPKTTTTGKQKWWAVLTKSHRWRHLLFPVSHGNREQKQNHIYINLWADAAGNAAATIAAALCCWKGNKALFYNLASNEMTTLSSTWWYAPKVVHIFLEHLRAFSFWSFFCHWNYIHECKFKVYGPFMGLVTK